MLRFKLFSGTPESLEVEVNGWLAAFAPDVTQMVQTVNASRGLSIAFLFEESFRGQEMRLSAEHHGARTTRPAIPVSRLPIEPLTVPVEPGSD